MTFIEKVKFLIKADNDPQYFENYFIDVHHLECMWQPGEIDYLKNIYPWLSVSYLNFIEEFDSIGIAWVSFFGSNLCNIIPLQQEINYWQKQSNNKYLPFAKDVDGSIYAFNINNEVIYFYNQDIDWEYQKKIANSFEKFIDDCLLGPRYLEFNFIENDQFYRFLVDQGWA